MIASAHVAAGVVAGMVGRNSTKHRWLRMPLAFTVGIASHVLLDAIPHADYGRRSAASLGMVVLCEAAGTLAIAALLLRGRLREHWVECLTAGIVGATIPDARFLAALVLPERGAEWVRFYGERFHRHFHARPIQFAIGMTTQVVCTVALMASLRLFPRTASAPFSARTSRADSDNPG